MNGGFCPVDEQAMSCEHTHSTSSLELADKLHELTCRSIGLELAIIGACKEAGLNSYGEGLAQLAGDLTKGLELFEKAFDSGLKTQSIQNNMESNDA